MELCCFFAILMHLCHLSCEANNGFTVQKVSGVPWNVWMYFNLFSLDFRPHLSSNPWFLSDYVLAKSKSKAVSKRLQKPANESLELSPLRTGGARGREPRLVSHVIDSVTLDGVPSFLLHSTSLFYTTLNINT
ncbi:hypothetical protein VNO77_17966 [Canavalia gladiata]|uniref:Secreted protein n=1 Tax=Canavalia gladiata TaxID=3824 RepID=A0AAN9LJY9_CANGL